ncbi:MAG: DUF58 domain-containing protein [Armatimonadetes bacterium]|nr:DUF58 domain-containing protein [Armatimonadota bacterium]
MTRYVTMALTVAAVFLIVMAVLVNSPPLFYMTVAVVATLAASRLQAWLAIQGLRFERNVPPMVTLGEWVTVETVVWSDHKLKRPLVSLEDVLPEGLIVRDRTPSLPVAPSFDQPITTRFRFKPLRRGRFRWRRVVIRGTDALGLVTMERSVQTEPVELTVSPVPIPVSVTVRPSAGWGVSDLESGLARGQGTDSRGVREYASGDSIRHIHWPTTAKTGRLMVKEFETGSGLNMAIVLQRTAGTEVGQAGATTFEAMCGHALYIADTYIEKGASVWFPVHEGREMAQQHPLSRLRAVREILTDVQCDQKDPVSADVSRIGVREGATLAVMLSVQDPGLPDVVSSLSGLKAVCLIYDAAEFDPASKALSAADPAYIAALETAGAEVQMMPKVEAVK